MSKVKEYIEETITEMVHRVTWPTWKELQANTILVVISSILIATYIFVVDFILGINPNSFWKGLLGFIYNM